MKKFTSFFFYLCFIKSYSVPQDVVIVQTTKHPLTLEKFNQVIPVEFQELHTFLNSFNVYGSRLHMLTESLLSLNLAEKIGISCINKSPFEIYSALLNHEYKNANISLNQVKDSFKRYKIQYFGISAPLKDKKWVQLKANLVFKEASLHGIESAVKKYNDLKTDSHQSVFHDVYNFSKESIDAHGKEFQSLYKLPLNKLSPIFSFTRNQRMVSGFCKIIQITNELPFDFAKRSEFYLSNYKKKEARKKLSTKLKNLAPNLLKWNNENFKALYQLYTLNHELGSTPDVYSNQLHSILNSAIKAYKTNPEGKRFGLLTAYNTVHTLQNLSSITEKAKSALNHQLIEVIKQIITLEKKHFKRDVKIHLELVNCLVKTMNPLAGTYLVETAENVNYKDLSSLDLILNEAKQLETKKLITLSDFKKVSLIISQKKAL